MRLKRTLLIGGMVALGAFTSCNPTRNDAGNRIKNFTADTHIMAEPAAKVKPKPTKEAEPQVGVLKDVKITPIEKPFTPETAAKLGFKKTPFFTGRYADSALWLDGKGNAIVTNEAGTRIDERGKLIEKSKDAVTIELENGEHVTYFPDGLFSSARLDTDGPRQSK